MERRLRCGIGLALALAAIGLALGGCTSGQRAAGAECPPEGIPNASRPEWPDGALGLQPGLPTGIGVTVAVIDSGLRTGFLPPHVVLQASSSLVEDESLADDDGHGTQMAQLVHRVAPDAAILALKAADRRGAARATWITEAVIRAREAGADVISLSLVTAVSDAALEAALDEAASAGAVIVIAAGNQQLDLDRFPRYPAAYETSRSLVVAASDAGRRLGGGTNWGHDTVDVAAPGVDVPVVGIDGEDRLISGSSPATALTAGAVAVLLSVEPDGSTVTDTVLRAASPAETLSGRISSGGLVDVGRALACLP